MKILVFAFSALCYFGAQAQNNTNKIDWKEEYRLNWSDFAMEPLEESSFHANTNTGISYSWSLKKSAEGMVELDYVVRSHFFPELSWVNPRSRGDHLLAHEQLHFDISELHARKLRQKLESLPVEKLGKKAKGILNRLYEEVDKERSAMQLLYDKETRHSLNEEAEAQWQNFVQQELKKSGKYKASN